jgi:RNA polymerase sigma-70 factor (ECF subfamily)
MSNPADAEDVLQAAFVKLMERGDSLRDQEKLVPWFYQLLRNLIVDQYRHRGATARMEEALTAESAQIAAQPDEGLFQAVCSCVNDVIAVLKPQDARLIQCVELESTPVTEAAKEIGITPGNASVRLHRARRAPREDLQTMCGVCAEHGCLACMCTKEPSP